MSYRSPYQTFIFENYSFDSKTLTAEFNYSFDEKCYFTEKVIFSRPAGGELVVDNNILDRALQLAFYLAGISYYKAFPTKDVSFKVAQPNQQQAEFLENVYSEGLSQFMFENNLTLDHTPNFISKSSSLAPVSYSGEGITLLQSGGKDSLLLAMLLDENGVGYTPWYVSSNKSYPSLLDDLAQPLKVARRVIDIESLKKVADEGALNGHVPVTYIILSYGLIQAVLQNQNTVMAAIGAEGVEPHAYIDNMAVSHQWSKTWPAERLLSDYVSQNISKDLHVGSPLRGLTELRIAELFVEKCWHKYGNSFSSCNLANYQQGRDNTNLKWCGQCPKCANSYLLFAPFVEPQELQALFSGDDLFEKPELTDTFKGLLNIDGVMKPFECIGEIDELRLAYHMARERYGTQVYQLPFKVPDSNFDYLAIGEHNPVMGSYLKSFMV